MQPEKWGRHLWKTIHYIALGYPENPPEYIKNAYKEFYINLWRFIPCYKCSKNYKEHLRELNIEYYLDSKEKLFEWTVLLHNIVNRSLGKQQILLQDAYNIYVHHDDNTDNNIVYKQPELWKYNIWKYTTILLLLIVIILLFRSNFRAILP